MYGMKSSEEEMVRRLGFADRPAADLPANVNLALAGAGSVANRKRVAEQQAAARGAMDADANRQSGERMVHEQFAVPAALKAWADRYGADQSLAGVKYTADKGLEGDKIAGETGRYAAFANMVKDAMPPIVRKMLGIPEPFDKDSTPYDSAGGGVIFDRRTGSPTYTPPPKVDGMTALAGALGGGTQGTEGTAGTTEAGPENDVQEIRRKVSNGKIAVYDAKTKGFLRYE